MDEFTITIKSVGGGWMATEGLGEVAGVQPFAVGTPNQVMQAVKKRGLELMGHVAKPRKKADE